jgi:hypothetical protein
MFLMIAGGVYLTLGLLVALGITRAARESDSALEHDEAGLVSRRAAPACPPANAGVPDPAPAPASRRTAVLAG